MDVVPPLPPGCGRQSVAAPGCKFYLTLSGIGRGGSPICDLPLYREIGGGHRSKSLAKKLGISVMSDLPFSVLPCFRWAEPGDGTRKMQFSYVKRVLSQVVSLLVGGTDILIRLEIE